jgi:serine protease Do
VAATAAGRDVTLTILRDGRQQELTVRIGRLEDSAKLLETSVKNRLGAEVRNLTAKEAEKYGLDRPQGVVITRIDPRGVLARAGLEVSDVILAVGNEQIDGVDTFVRRVNALPAGRRIALTVLDHRTGEIGSLEVTIK